MTKTLVVTRLAVIGLIFFVSACTKPPKILSLSGQTMGTSYHIKVAGGENIPDKQALQAKIDAALETVNDQMSTYRKKSELSRFNQMAVGGSITVSPDTAHVIQTGIDLYHQTDGALDITLGPLVNLWGFGPDKRPTKTPSPELIAKIKAETGIQYLTVEGLKLSKSKPHLYVDLSSIAKGFGVDKIAKLLSQYQPKGYLVEIGGELSSFGVKADGSAWRVAIERPDVNDRRVQQVISPGNMAMATSGNYRNYYEQQGRRYTHIIDPRTGYPVDHRLASVTVLNQQCMIADGYATAMMVLGTRASLALAKKHNLAIMLIEKQDDGFKVYYSEAFKHFVESST